MYNTFIFKMSIKVTEKFDVVWKKIYHEVEKSSEKLGRWVSTLNAYSNFVFDQNIMKLATPVEKHMEILKQVMIWKYFVPKKFYSPKTHHRHFQGRPL